MLSSVRKEPPTSPCYSLSLLLTSPTPETLMGKIILSSMPKVIIIGGGIAGCSVAVELALRGASVTLVERNQPGVGATGASAGILAPQYEADASGAAFHFGVACKEAYPAFVERLQKLAAWEVGFRTDGMLVANHSKEEEEASRRELLLQEAAGLEGEILSSSDARRIHEAVSMSVHSWLWLPREAQVDSQRLAVALADAVQSAGVRLVRGTRVMALVTEGSRVTGVRLEDGVEIGAPWVVMAAGAWSGEIAAIPTYLPVRPVRGQILRLLPPRPLPWTLVCSHQGRYLVPRVNGTVLVGSTMEEVGYDDRVTEEGTETLAGAAAALLPILEEATIVEAWAGLRPISPDGWPILGPDPELDGLLYATGHGRNGILFAPLTARAVAHLILDGETNVAWEAFRIDRFTDEKRRAGPEPTLSPLPPRSSPRTKSEETS
jgi:glycine oxidase